MTGRHEVSGRYHGLHLNRVRRAWPARWWWLALVAVLSIGVAGVVALLPRGAAAPGPAQIAVNQVGYAAGGAKVAYLLAGAGNAGSHFEVVNAAGRVVGTGAAKASVGAWNAAYGAVYPLDFSSVDSAGVYRLRLAEHPAVTSPPFTLGGAEQLYAPLAARAVRFFQAQRDGQHVVTSVLARRPSHAHDGAADVYASPGFDAGGRLAGSLQRVGGPVDVSGGWFDAGDYLKFTGTTAYALVNLLLAEREGNADAALRAEAGYGLEWLGRMWDGRRGVLYAQVGLGDGNDVVLGDHDLWRLPETDDAARSVGKASAQYLNHRPVFAANAAGAPLSPNLAGRVAAAFALAAALRSGTDRAGATAALDDAAAVYQLADTGGSATLVTAFPHSYYPEDSWADDMELGAVELALAARRLGDGRADRWLGEAAHWAGVYLAEQDRSVLGLDDVSALAHLDLAMLAAQVPQPPAEARAALDDVRSQLATAAGRTGKDPFGAAVDYRTADAAAGALGVAVTAARYARVTGDRGYAGLALAQAGWVLGANPWGTSFVVGAGTRFPRCLHHQIANLAGSLDGTGNVLAGAVVNGPTAADDAAGDGRTSGMRACPVDGTDSYAAFTGRDSRYVDDVRAWQSVEPAIDVTSAALLAFTLLARATA